MSFASGSPSLSTSTDAMQCPPLRDACTPRLYRHNAFRILDLPVDAGVREIARQVDRLQKLAEFSGPEGLRQAHAFALNPPPALDQIREAAQRLKDPEQRLVDEFFSFWPATETTADDPALQALRRGDAPAALALWQEQAAATKPAAQRLAARHNLAIACHLQALDGSLWDLQPWLDIERGPQGDENLWEAALDHWSRLAADPLVWDWVRHRITTLDDPRLTTGLARRMESALLPALASINTWFALEYARLGRPAPAQRHLRRMRALHLDPLELDRMAAPLLKPARERLQRAITAAREEGKRVPATAVNITRRLLSECAEVRPLLTLLHGSLSHHHTGIFDETAQAGCDVLWDFKRANHQSPLVPGMVEELLALATAPNVRRALHAHGYTAVFQRINDIFRYADNTTVPGSPWATLMYERVCKQVLPELARLTPLAGPDHELTLNARHNCARLLSAIARKAAKDQTDHALALEAAEAARPMANDQALRNELAHQARWSRSMLEPCRCECCNKEAAVPKLMLNVTVRRSPEQPARLLRVPRCRTCSHAQARHWQFALWAALPGAIVAPLVGWPAVILGFAAALIGAGLWVLYKSNFALTVHLALLLMLGGLGALGEGLSSKNKGELCYLAVWQIPFGAITAASLAFVIGWFTRVKHPQALKAHPECSALAAEGYRLVSVTT